MTINTVGELKAALADLQDHMPAEVFSGSVESLVDFDSSIVIGDDGEYVFRISAEN